MTSKADQRRLDLIHAMPCIACKSLGVYCGRSEAHHIVDKGYRRLSGGDQSTLPLCAWHHRGVPLTLDGTVKEMTATYGPSLAVSKREFIRRFGTERELLAIVDELINSTQGNAMKKLPLRQGDVLLVPVDEIPAEAVLQPPKGKKLILALGEATGHHHRFEFLDTSHNVKLYVSDGGPRYVHVIKGADLLHEEHSTARVPVGKYVLPTQVEYTPAELRRVID